MPAFSNPLASFTSGFVATDLFPRMEARTDVDVAGGAGGKYDRFISEELYHDI